MTPEFHVVYTPGTVRTLSLFAWSLLEHTDARYCLVSNGCSVLERTFLAALATRDPRLRHRDLGPAMLPHGEALDLLLEGSSGPWFGFLDSDLLATGDFVLPTPGAAVFTGRPTWVAASEETLGPDFQVVSGTFQRDSRGLPLGSTYCALYDRSALLEARHEARVGFAPGPLPDRVRQRLAEAGLERSVFDTGKVLNALLALSCVPLSWRPDLPVRHLGGVSFGALRARGRFGLLSRLRAERECRRQLADAGASAGEIRQALRQRLRQRDPVREWFDALLPALYEGRALPRTVRTGVAEVDSAVAATAAALQDLFARRRDEVPRHWRLLWG